MKIIKTSGKKYDAYSKITFQLSDKASESLKSDFETEFFKAKAQNKTLQDFKLAVETSALEITTTADAKVEEVYNAVQKILDAVNQEQDDFQKQIENLNVKLSTK